MVNLARLNSIFSELLLEHRDALALKQIRDERALRKILCCDYEKILNALVELKSTQVEQLVCEEFFRDEPAVALEILDHVTEQRLNHVGFEILEPLDLVVQGIEFWVDHLNRNLGSRIEVKKYLRFPASANFQRRVNAFTEIMCIWLRVDEQVLVLELFDIAHGVERLLPVDKHGALYHINPEKLLNDEWVVKHHRQAMRRLFEPDAIWHYSIPLNRRETVDALHRRLQALVVRQPLYKMAYGAPVENCHDGSYHTKIINQDQGLELELCHLSSLQND
jgi:hypothetical protein